ncbi:MAG: hypothetical protein JWO36_6275 [Myxococcales bacterium]|nr:hypothetical protein [Myxococcales bacterium]
MIRWLSPSTCSLALALAFGFGSGVAAAEPAVDTTTDDTIDNSSAPSAGRREIVITPAERFTPHQSQISPFLYLNRCTGGCTIHGTTGTNDARTQSSSIPAPGTYVLTEFATGTNMTGTAADAEWQMVVDCMKEVYSPFAIQVSDTIPAGGVSYTEALIAGQPGDIGLGTGILGIAPLAGDCSPQDNVISFSFANHHTPGLTRVDDICWTAAQETAHAFGLDHEITFADGSSACNDPMTYNIKNPCGGRRYFRNKPASCGEDVVRPCRCGGSQNSHLKILNVFGPGMSTTPPPTTSIIVPVAGPVQNGFTVQAKAFSKRGVEKIELWLNGYKWAEAKGASFGNNGQLETVYPLTTPASVPNGIIDVVVKAYDDLGIKTDSTTVTVMKGPACANAATDCAKGQKCDAGKCFWDPPNGVLGDACAYNQFCTSGICSGTADTQICTQDCIAGVADSCPTDYDCIATSGTSGICFPAGGGGGGCCSVGGGGSNAIWAHLGLCAAVLALLTRRRRRPL